MPDLRIVAAAVLAVLAAGCGGRPVAQATGGTVMWAVGDGAIDKPAAHALARTIAADRPARVLYLGDVYESGTAAEFRRNFTGVYAALRGRIWPTPGNHEWANRRTGYDRYWHGLAPWYARRVAGWDVLSLNSEAAHGAGSAQLRWLRARLRGDKTCRIAFWHRPRYSAGRHGDQPDVAPLWNALRGHAALVLNGHDHDLQRFRRRDGLVEIVAGAGGNERYGVRRHAGTAFADDDHYGAARLALRRGGATVQLVASGGRVLDSTRVTCRA